MTRKRSDHDSNGVRGRYATPALATVLLLGALALPSAVQAQITGQCMQALAGLGTLNCTANDAGLTIVDIKPPIDPCVCPDPSTGLTCNDTTTFDVIGAVNPNNANERYDLGIWVSLVGTSALTDSSCMHTTLNGTLAEPPGTPGLTTTPNLANGGDLEDGNGPYRDIDGDFCGDLLKTDITGTDPTNSMAVIMNFRVSNMACNAANATGGLMNIATATSWKGQNRNDCATEASALPDGKPKCAGAANLVNLPFATMTDSCTCHVSEIQPGGSVICDVAVNNTSPTCSPLLTEPLSQQCGTMAYFQFQLTDDQGGTFSNPVPQTGGGTTSGAPGASVIWNPAPSGDLNVLRPQDSASLQFAYTALGTLTSGQTINITLQPQYIGDETTKPLASPINHAPTATCTLNVNPNYATVTGMSAARSAFGGTMVSWTTDGEIGSLGFNLYRLNEQTKHYDKVNQQLLAASQNTSGGVYHFRDNAVAGDTATYKVEEVRDNGQTMMFAPFRVSVQAAQTDEAPGDFSAVPHPISPRMALRLAGSGTGHYSAALGTQGKQTKAAGSGSMAQIGTGQEGIYYLSAGDIANAIGASNSKAQNDIKRGQLVLTNQGQEVAWQAASGDSGIYFYGAPYDDVYTDTNVYYLKEGTGTRMSTETAGAGAPVSGITFTDTAHSEQSPVGMARPDVATDPHQDYVFWGVVSGASNTFNGSIDLSGVGAGGTATLKANLFGAASPSYSAGVSVNGTSIGTVTWSGNGPTTQSLTFSQSLIHTGSNTVTVTQNAGTIFIDSFDVTYARQYRAVDNALAFTGDGNSTVSVSGFGSGQISVYNVSDPTAPTVVQGASIGQATDGSWQVSFQPSSSSARYLAVSTNGVRADAGLSGFSPGNLKGTSGTNYVVIAPDSMADAAQALASYRNGKVVTLSQIYYAFNNGLSSPEAIKAFLSYAYSNWSPRPQYVVLAAKGSYDYKDEEGVGGNLLPPLMAPSRNGLVAADNALADFNGDNVPEMAVGRLPVLSTTELTAAINKIKGYDSGPGTGASVVFVADNADSGGNYATTSDQLVGDIGSVSSSKIYLDLGYTVSGARQAILNAINSGVQVFNYVGHGSFSQLAQEGLLTSADVSTLTNGNRQPLLIATTCIVADFALPGYSSLGENLVLYGNGGAAAVFGPSWLSYNTDASKLNGLLLTQLYQSGTQSIGQAVRKAMVAYSQAGGASDMLSVYNLLGDPATTLK